MKIEEKLKMKRTELKLSQKELAGKAGVAQCVISRMESGNYRKPILERIEKVLDRVGLEIVIQEKEEAAI